MEASERSGRKLENLLMDISFFGHEQNNQLIFAIIKS